MEFNLFNISTISFKYEHNFIKTSYAIITQRNNLNRKIIETKRALQSCNLKYYQVFYTYIRL